jgi:RNA polymerase sigma-70 factor (ECF subfamily)
VRGDLEIVRRARSGDRHAFEDVYRTHVGRVYAVCLRLSANPEQAAEWTQDTFVRAWEMLGSYRGESAFSTWLHRVTVNVALHALRTDRRRTTHFQGTDDLESYDRAGYTPDEESFDLEKAVAALPNRTRAVFVLHDIEGYPHAEIAEMMDIKTGTSKALLHRAHALLKKALLR